MTDEAARDMGEMSMGVTRREVRVLGLLPEWWTLASSLHPETVYIPPVQLTESWNSTFNKILEEF